jgi:hypothetical protein
LFTEKLNDYAVGTNHVGTVNSPIGGQADIWLVFFKDNKVSNRIAIKTGSGEVEVGWGWGDETQSLLDEIIESLIVPSAGYPLAASDFNALPYIDFYGGARTWTRNGTFNLSAGHPISYTNRYAVSFVVTIMGGTLPDPFAYNGDHPTQPQNARVVIERTSATTANVNFSFGAPTQALVDEIVAGLIVPNENHQLIPADHAPLQYASFNASERGWLVGSGSDDARYPMELYDYIFLTNAYRVVFTLTLKSGVLIGNTLPDDIAGEYPGNDSNTSVIINRTSDTQLEVWFNFGNYSI